MPYYWKKTVHQMTVGKMKYRQEKGISLAKESWSNAISLTKDSLPNDNWSNVISSTKTVD